MTATPENPTTPENPATRESPGSPENPSTPGTAITPAVPDTADRAPGYAPRRTLRFGVELQRQLSRRRTGVMAALLAAVPLVMAAAFAIGGDDMGEGRRGISLLDVATASAANFAVTCMFVSGGLLVAIPVALFFGDSVASEASWSSLRYLLAMPVPRARLLGSKMAVAATLSLAAIILLPAVGLFVGLFAYGWGPLVLPTGGVLPADQAISRIAIVVGYTMLTALVVAGMAFWLSTRTDSPLGAVGGGLGLVILGSILGQIDALGDLREYLPSYWQFAWVDALSPTIDWSGMINGVSVALTYAVVLFALAFRSFTKADILS